MNPYRFVRLKEVLFHAVELSGKARRDYLSRACGNDLELLREVEGILAHEADAHSVLGDRGLLRRVLGSVSDPSALFEQIIGDSSLQQLLGEGARCEINGAGIASGELLANRYRIERFLARGGMGEVYCAQDLELGIAVALKIIRPEIASDPAALRQLKQEVLAARSVTHRNVCRIYDHGRHRDEVRDVAFLSMEFLPGETLASRLRSRGHLGMGEALPLVKQLAEALDAAHCAGIVHRDFKSANVVLVPDEHGERAVVTDFGLAVATEEDTTEQGAGDSPGEVQSSRLSRLMGTPAYMAPEQVRGEPVGAAADLYALGVVLYEMMTGLLPFDGATPLEMARARLVTPPPPPSSLVELDPAWDTAILRLLAPSPEARYATAAEAVQVLEGRPAAPRPTTRRSGPGRTGYSLPAERDAFVGRQRLLRSLSAHLEPAASLLTLTGPGGTGKTRIARHYGWESLDRWVGGVWFCDLTEARSVNGIVYAVARALDVPLAKDDPILQLGHAIAGRGRALIILDNFEQVVTHASATLGHWLARAPETSFLVTSRERLRLEGETTLEVEPLDPVTDGLELFIRRAQVERPGFAVTAENTTIVTQIVRILEGLPLAIEMAACSLNALSPAQLLDRLRDRFAVLSGTKRGRQWTLRTTLDWSWALLQPWERAALAQASVFEGGATLEAVEAVIDLNRWLDAPPVLDVIRSLVDKSWFQTRVVSGTPRFHMYATLQEYAAGKLRGECSEENAPVKTNAEERHGRYFAALGTDEALEALEVHGGARRRHELQQELGNLAVACRRAVERSDGWVAVFSHAALSEVVWLQGPTSLGLELGLGVLEIPGLTSELSARAHLNIGRTLCTSGRPAEALGHLETALAIYRDVGDTHLEELALAALGVLHRDQGRRPEARECFRAALAILREVGDRRREAIILMHSGALESEPDARRQLEDALAIHREFGNRRGEATVLAHLGNSCAYQGHWSEARGYYEAALAIARENGDRRNEGTLIGNLGVVERRWTVARDRHEAALTLHRETGNRQFEGTTLGRLGLINFDEARTSEARECFEAALAIHREVADRRSEGLTLASLALVDLDQGRRTEAREHLDAALAIVRENGFRHGEAVVFENLAVFYREQGRTAEARASLEAALQISHDLGNRLSEGTLRGSLASLEAQAGHLEEARALFDEGEALLRSIDKLPRLGNLLCARSEYEILAGDRIAARLSLDSAAALAAELGATPNSSLGRAIAKVRAALGKDAAESELP